VLIVRTPLRVSLFGGGTDFPEYFSKKGGGVIGFAIDKYIYHTISRFPSWLFDHKLRFAYSIVEQVKNIDEIKHTPFREILKFHDVYEDIEVNLASDLPSFAGLGSSSAFTVGLSNGLNAFNGHFIDMRSLAKTAIHIERDILNESVGLQDQIFASYGGFNHINFYGNEDFEVERIGANQGMIKKLSSNLFMYYTGITRRAIEIEKVKLERLDINMVALDRMYGCVSEARNALSRGESLDELGYLLNESWKLKRTLSNDVSNQHIDEIYEMGLKNGALGGKLLGAGGGGFLLFYVPEKSHIRFQNAFGELHQTTFNINLQGSMIIHADF